jgi:Flp pilus assembly pilin Flp
MVTLSAVVQSWFVYISESLKREEGQGFGEYALIFALVVVVAAGSLTPLGTKIRDTFDAVVAAF